MQNCTRRLTGESILISFQSKIPKSSPIPLLINILFTFFSKAHTLHYSKANFSVVANELGIRQFNENDYRNAMTNYKGKLNYILSLFKEYDLKSKGVNDIGTNSTELAKELIYKILSA